MPEPERRRRRPAVSCTLCRKRKIRCNKELPCNNCLRSKTGACVYDSPPHAPHQHQQRLPHQQEPRLSGQFLEINELTDLAASQHATPQDTTTNRSTASGPARRQSTSLATGSTSPTLVNRSADPEADALRSRVKELEEKLSRVSSSPAQNSTNTGLPVNETISTGLSGTFHIQQDSNLFGLTQATSRGVVHKKRLFGQSHWINGGFLMFKDLAAIIEPYVLDESSKAVYTIGRCKALARHIKSKRAPDWPILQTSDLPPKDVADELVDCYLGTVETLYRILHVPTFRRDYDALWVSQSDPDPAFLVKLKLVLALGGLTHDDRFSMRSSAVTWVYEAQTWVSDPRFKARLSIDFLQTHLLLLLAREIVINNCEAIWISAGSLVRLAMFMGLHRDPARFPKQSCYSSEMRRRLWNTILEACLQSTMASGGPPLMSMQDFDTQPPGNFDDDQLETEDPTAKPENEFTQVTIARALRKTFPQRLAVAKCLNDAGSRTTYDEAMKLDRELRASYRELCKALQAFQSCGRTLSPFAVRAADIIMHRYISSLHIPFFDRALHDSACTYSRKVAVDSALKIWCGVYPSPSILASQSRAVPDDGNLARFVKCGTGFFRTVSVQAHIIIALELRAQLQEDDGLGPVPVRQDLLSVLEDGERWMTQCIEAGETNPKGYLFHNLILAQIHAIIRGASKEELAESLVKAAEEAGDTCLRLLEDMAAEGQPEGASEELDQIPWRMPTGLMSNMQFMLSEDLLDCTTPDPMNWGFTNDTTPMW